jgi:hypothetical protein
MVHISRSRLPLQTGNAHSRKPKTFFAVRAINKSAQNLSALFDLRRKPQAQEGLQNYLRSGDKPQGVRITAVAPWARSPLRNSGCR